MSYDIHEDKKENHTIVEQGETGSTGAKCFVDVLHFTGPGFVEFQILNKLMREKYIEKCCKNICSI